MKKIDKGKIPDFFSQYIKRSKPEQWNETASVRSDLRTYILKEQGYCCAYTEIRLNDDNSHIDHYRTRNLFPRLTFEYTNLLVSCNSEQYGARYKDKLVKRQEEYKDLINPVEESSSGLMEFTFTGRVESIDNSCKGEQTIRFFNLNERSLVERRKTVIACLIGMKGLTEKEVVESTGEFETMIRQLYNNIQSA
jgi:uncharacterized protein (TIGR02646 family)